MSGRSLDAHRKFRSRPVQPYSASTSGLPAYRVPLSAIICSKASTIRRRVLAPLQWAPPSHQPHEIEGPWKLDFARIHPRGRDVHHDQAALCMASSGFLKHPVSVTIKPAAARQSWAHEIVFTATNLKVKANPLPRHVPSRPRSGRSLRSSVPSLASSVPRSTCLVITGSIGFEVEPNLAASARMTVRFITNAPVVARLAG